MENLVDENIFAKKKYRKAKEATNTFANSIQSKIDITLNLF